MSALGPRLRPSLLAFRALLAAAVYTVIASAPSLASAQGRGGGAGAAVRTIEDRTAAMRKLDGYFPLYWDSTAGQLFMEISRWNTQVLQTAGLAAGLGSNDIGLDRGGSLGSRIVTFERVGPK